MSSQYELNINRAEKWIDAMAKMKNYTTQPSREERYEALRESYATGSIDLEDFTAQVVTLLREGI
jgi:hypothetical protein